MSKQVMRYDVCWDGTIMKPGPDGDWVEIEDFEALEAERDALRAALQAMIDHGGEDADTHELRHRND